MALKKVIQELQRNINSYEPFWFEWIQQDSCTLNKEDLYISEVHLKNNFTISLFESFMFFNQSRRIQQLNQELSNDYLKFQEWIIEEFLFSLIRICKGNIENFYLPIWELNISNALKLTLLNFHVFTIAGIFLKYNEDDLRSTSVFNKILLSLENTGFSKHSPLNSLPMIK